MINKLNFQSLYKDWAFFKPKLLYTLETNGKY